MREMSPVPSVRFSIKANKRKQQNEYTTKYYCSILSIVFISACIIAIIFEISKGLNKQQDYQIYKNEGAKQEDVSLVVFQSNEDVFQINNSHSISIPVVKNIQQNKCQKNRKYQLQQSLVNIKIFQLLHNGSVSNHNDILDRYFMKIMPLYVIKHAKFTSVRKQAEISVTNLNWWNPFYDSDSQSYKGVNKIFEKNNKQKWVSSGKYLTIVSDELIRPTYIILNIPGGETRPKNVYMYGISASQTVLTNKNTLESTFIKKIGISAGRNQIQCDVPQCAGEYSMIMFVFDPVEIITLEVYSRKLHLNI